MNVPQNLIEALVQWADAQPSVSAWFPGGVYQGLMPNTSATVLPYLTFEQTGSRIVNLIGRDSGVSFIEIALEARAATAAVARQTGEKFRDLLIAAGPMTWAGGIEAGRVLMDGETGELDDELGPDGTDVWVHRIPVAFTTARW